MGKNICPSYVSNIRPLYSIPFVSSCVQVALCKATTSRKLGFRLCGMRVWVNGEYMVKDKPYGAAISGLDGMVKAIKLYLDNGEVRKKEVTSNLIFEASLLTVCHLIVVLEPDMEKYQSQCMAYWMG